MGKLFGTDGVRGVVNEDLDGLLAYQLGMAGAYVLTKATHKTPTIVIGKDTRISGDMLESALLAGICAMGANVFLLGVLPTPAVAYLVRKMGADAGVMISASHNPMEHNGIKFFDASGNKLSDALEEEIESIILGTGEKIQPKTGAEIGRVKMYRHGVDEYVDFVASTVDTDISGIKCIVDCANGSASTTARKLFDKLGVKADIINCVPNGININDNCGSTHIDQVADYVRKGDYDVGIAFDGDADRCLIVDEKGDLVDGDKIIAACACHLKKLGRLKNNTAVVTVLTNMGFYEMAKKNDIDVVASNVGDRYVLEEMQKGGFVLGGEQSGHIIFLDHNSTGDGQITATQFLSVMSSQRKSASQVASIMTNYPQVMRNVPVTREVKENYQHDPEIQKAIEEVRCQLGKEGRILVRPSGTESLVRVMIEGKDQQEIERLAEQVAQVIQNK
ncbi:MAG: phosphoglucosamine mutase [Eubacteriales bacterium]|jgi:phosphoglucosamine mutase